MKRYCESPSSLTLYLTCPQRYAFKYRDKLPDPMGAAAQLGTDFHNAAYRTWAARGYKHLPIGTFTPQICAMLDALYQHPEVQKLPTEFAFPPEQKVKYDYGNGTLFGVIDMGLTDGSVNDFKTSSKKWTEEKVRENFQHLSYTWLARMTKLSPATIFRYIVVTTGNNPFVQVITIHVTQEYIDAYIKQAQEITGYIELDLFYPTPSRACNYCPYKNVCPAFTQPSHAATGRIPLEQD